MASISWDVASLLLPLLQRVADTHPDASTRQTAADIRVLIATHGRVDLGSRSGFAETEPPKPTPIDNSVNSNDASVNEVDNTRSKPQTLIEVISSSTDAAVTETVHSQTDQSSSQSPPSAFETAVKEVGSVLVPMRGHALLTLRRLVNSDDTEALNSVDKVLAVCDQSLDDADSYVYLNCIQLLSSLASRLPQQTLPWLADRYIAVSQSDGGSQPSGAERRMKLGEVLVKTSSALGMHLVHTHTHTRLMALYPGLPR